MNAPTPIPKLKDHCPEFAEVWRDYERAQERGVGVEAAYSIVQLVAKAFIRGGEFERSKLGAAIKGQLIELADGGSIGEMTARRVMRELGVVDA